MSAPDANCWMRDIPADIDLIATDIASLIPSRVVTVNRTFAAIVIARAILAERERCAQIAKDRSSKCIEHVLIDDCYDYWQGAASSAEIIAILINPSSQPVPVTSEKTSAAHPNSAAEGQSPAPQEAP